MAERRLAVLALVATTVLAAVPAVTMAAAPAVTMAAAPAVTMAAAPAVTMAAAPAVTMTERAMAATARCPWMDASKLPAERASELLAAMSPADKLSLLAGGGGFGSVNGPNPQAAGFTPANPTLCLPALVMNDATAGVGDFQTATTAFPDAIAVAASWDPLLGRTLGQAVGAEAFAKGVNVLLGPGVDIARTPLNGRSFEYLGEDPYLAGQMSAGVIRGIQDEHVVATVKHYALNDQETDRNTVSADADERTMQEIDLPAYEAAVKAGVGALMCAYNRVNATYSCENPYLLTTVLRRQLGFTGWTMSDWNGTHSTVAAVKAGLDQEMPSATYFGSKLQAAIAAHQLPPTVLDQMTYPILLTMFRIGLFDHVPNEGAVAAATPATSTASIAVARSVAEQGSVLLKNAAATLPLTGPGKRIALIGPAAGPTGAIDAEQGYGSAHVTVLAPNPAVTSPVQALTARAAQAGDLLTYADGSQLTDAVSAAKAADTAIVVIADAETEGFDRPDLHAHVGTCSPVSGCSYQQIDQDRLIAAVANANPHTVVVIQSGGPVVMPWLPNVQAVLQNWLPGQVDGDALAALLFGDVTPSGKLPVTFPEQLGDGPIKTTAQYPGVKDVHGVPHATYSERLLVGYRWYDTKHVAPLFPFGFGLSYTTFRYSDLSITPTSAGGATVRFTITNTGQRTGAEVGQIYVSMPTGTGEPAHQLKGFAKVTLNPGQSTAVAVSLDQRAFSYWRAARHRWTIAPGCYGIAVGGSSADLALTGRIGRAGGRCGSSARTPAPARPTTRPRPSATAPMHSLAATGLSPSAPMAAAGLVAGFVALMARRRRAHAGGGPRAGGSVRPQRSSVRELGNSFDNGGCA